MQGSVWGPLCCTSTMDKIGQRAYKSGSPLYTYKGQVSVPPLGMVDDEITMARCTVESTKTNAFMNNFTEMKKLQFGAKKCKKMHVGKQTTLCADIKIHNENGRVVITPMAEKMDETQPVRNRQIHHHRDRAQSSSMSTSSDFSSEGLYFEL